MFFRPDFYRGEKEKSAQVYRDLYTSKILIDCTKVPSFWEDISAAMNELLKFLSNFFISDRTYVFEIDYKTGTLSDTYEYAKEEVTKEIHNLQTVPIAVIDT